MPRTKKTPESIVPKQAPKKVLHKQPATNMPSFVTAIIITALFVGGIVFFGQQRIVNKNKQELDESNQRISQLTSQLNELQNVINGNATKETQIEGTKYYNTKYKFALTILKSWENYQTKERDLSLGSLGKFDSIDFYFDETKPIFNIGVINKEAWEDTQKLDYYSPIKITENDTYVFAFSFHKDADQTVIESLRTDIEQIISTFKFEEMPQAQAQIEKCAGTFDVAKGKTKVSITFLDKNISSEISGCYQENPDVLLTTDKYIYLAFKPVGIGGYILYGKYSGFYRTDLSNNETERIFDNSNDALVVTDIDISPDMKFAVYKLGEENSFIIKNLETGKVSQYELPVSGSDMQFGNFKFSPDSSKVAIAIGYGPEKERGAVYVFEIATKKFSSYQKFDSKIPYIDSWKDNKDLNLK